LEVTKCFVIGIRQIAHKILFSISEPGDKADELFEKLKTDYSGNVNVFSAMLSSLEPSNPKRPGVLPFFDDESLTDLVILFSIVY